MLVNGVPLAAAAGGLAVGLYYGLVAVERVVGGAGDGDEPSGPCRRPVRASPSKYRSKTSERHVVDRVPEACDSRRFSRTPVFLRNYTASGKIKNVLPSEPFAGSPVALVIYGHQNNSPMDAELGSRTDQ